MMKDKQSDKQESHIVSEYTNIIIRYCDTIHDTIKNTFKRWRTSDIVINKVGMWWFLCSPKKRSMDTLTSSISYCDKCPWRELYLSHNTHFDKDKVLLDILDSKKTTSNFLSHKIRPWKLTFSTQLRTKGKWKKSKHAYVMHLFPILNYKAEIRIEVLFFNWSVEYSWIVLARNIVIVLFVDVCFLLILSKSYYDMRLKCQSYLF